MLTFFVGYLTYTKSVIEGHLDTCNFSNMEEALIIAQRELAFTVKSSPELRGLEFNGKVAKFRILSGGNSAVVLFTAKSDPSIKRELFILEDCTQAIQNTLGMKNGEIFIR